MRADKGEILDLFRTLLQERRVSLEGALNLARDGTRLDMQDRPTNRGERAAVTTQGYLADGIATRLHEIRTALEILERVDLGPREVACAGALVYLKEVERDKGTWILLLPGGAGERIDTETDTVTILSPLSHLGRELKGCGPGDTVTVLREGRETLLEVEEVG